MTPKFISLLLLISGAANAATYQWTGNASATWTDQSNWMPAGSSGGSFPVTLTNGPAPTGGTFLTSRLNVNNVAGQDLVYSAEMGTTVYGGDANGRGLVIGSNSNGTMTINGGVVHKQFLNCRRCYRTPRSKRDTQHQRRPIYRVHKRNNPRMDALRKTHRRNRNY